MLSGTELQRILPLLSKVAAEYLRTGEYSAVTTLGGESLTPVQRRTLDAFRDDPTKVSAAALSSVIANGYTTEDFQQVLEPIIFERRGREGDIQRETERLSSPSPDRPPAGPLPAGQKYVYDYSRNVWMVVEGGTKFITDVNQQGRSVPALAPEGEEPPTSGSTVYTDALGRPTVGIGFGRGQRTYDYGDIELQALGGDVAEGIAAVAGDGTTAAVSGVEGVPVETGVPPDWETAAAEMYPEYYAIVKNNPEIAALLRRSIAEDWSETKFQAELRGTNWWKTTTASAREWDAASALDPATYQAKVDTAAADIQQEALNLGIRLSSERLQKLALDSERFGWGSQMITNAIGMAATEGGTAGATQLREGYYGQAVRNTARQYGVTLADSTFSSFVNKIAVGEETLGSFQDYALGIAKSLYPPLAEQFDAGRTFDEITGSYQQMAANILERDAESIDMMDPTFVTAVTYQPDPKTGEQRMMNLQEWGNYLRTNESLGYQYTTEARSRAYEVATKFANMFGKV